MNNDTPDAVSGTDSGINFLLWVVPAAFVRSVTVFTRHDFGSDYIGVPGVFTLLTIPIFAGIFPHLDPTPLMFHLAAYVAMILVARVRILYRWWRGIHYHSRYSGRPWLCTLFPLLNEPFTKTWIEPPLVIGASLLLVDWNEGFASHLFWAGVALWVTEIADDLSARRELQTLRDGYFEQAYRGQQFGSSA